MNEICKDCAKLRKNGSCLVEGLQGHKMAEIIDNCLYHETPEEHAAHAARAAEKVKATLEAEKNNE